MRAFLAFEIPEDIKGYLRSVARGMARTVSDVRWVRDEGIHITMKFFGDITPDLAEAVRGALTHVPGRYPPMEASLAAVDAFPDKRRARVIIVRLEKGVDNLRSIFKDIQESLASLGIEKESRTFTPHLTLGRKKIPAPLLERDIPDLETRTFPLGRLVLFESVLTREGSIYTPKWALTLGGKDGQGGE